MTKTRLWVGLLAAGLLMFVMGDDPAIADTWEEHSGCEGAYYEQEHCSPIYSDIEEYLDLLIFTYSDTNQTETPEVITISDEVSRTHSWSVGGSVSAEIKAGMLTKVIADGKVGVEVNGEYSGSKEKKYTISRQITVPACRTRIRREYVDDYEADDFQITTTSGYWCCPVHGIESYNLPQFCTGNGDGDTNLHGATEDGGPYSQSSNPCLDCYVGS